MNMKKTAWTVLPIIIATFMFDSGVRGHRHRLEGPKNAIGADVTARRPHGESYAWPGALYMASAPRPAEAPPSTPLIRRGEELYNTKGCSACHSTDGTRIVGPSWKGIYGTRVRVVTNGRERVVTVDDEYIKRSELDPNYDVVVGYPAVMPSESGILSDEEISAITEYIKSLK